MIPEMFIKAAIRDILFSDAEDRERDRLNEEACE